MHTFSHLHLCKWFRDEIALCKFTVIAIICAMDLGLGGVNEFGSHFTVINAIATLLFFISCCDCISHETETAMRDFSKLRLEKRIPTLISSSGNKMQEVDFNEQNVAATEDIDIGFKPSYPDINNQNSQELGLNDPSRTHHSHNNPIEHLGDNRNNSPEDYPEPGFGGFFSPPQSQQNPNFSHRPLIGGPGLEEDVSSVGMSVGPAGYSIDKNNNNRRPEMSNNPDDANDEGEGDVQFIPVPPSHDFISGIENGEGVERGYGGLFDGDSNDADSDDNENEQGYFGDGGGGGRIHHHGGPRGHHEGPDNSDDSTDDNTRGFDNGRGGGGGGGGGSVGGPNRYNPYDYGDY